MRKYALVVLDKQDKLLDRYNLDVVTNPTDNGFELDLTVISSDIEEIITKVVQKKKPIKLTVYHHNNAYSKSNILASWIQKYSTTDYKMALEYDDGNIVRYCEGKVISLSKTELDEYKGLAQDMQFKMTTPYFVKRENTITIQVSTQGKTYPFKYPYCYGAFVMENNVIENPYISSVPLIITIDGAIDNPTIELLDANGVSYNKVKFSGESIHTGEQLIINSAQRKIYKVSNGKEIDFRPQVDPQYDTFLRAISGTSSITINTKDSADGFKLIGGWREYLL